MSTMIAPYGDETEKRVAIKPAQPGPSAAPTSSSDFYIVAPLDSDLTTPAVYALSTVPDGVLLAWVDDILEAERRQGLMLSVIIRGFDALETVRFLDEKRISMRRYLYTSYDAAARALDALKAAKSSAESEGGNGE